MATGTVAASTALADAGIEMLGLVISCAAVSQPTIHVYSLVRALMKMQTLIGEEIWLDPNHDEAAAGAGTLVLACMPALNVVTNVWQNGTMSPKQGLEVSFPQRRVRRLLISFSGQQCMAACQERCATIHSIVSQSLVSNFVPQ